MRFVLLNGTTLSVTFGTVRGANKVTTTTVPFSFSVLAAVTNKVQTTMYRRGTLSSSSRFQTVLQVSAKNNSFYASLCPTEQQKLLSPPALVLFKPIIQRVLCSGGVFSFTDTGSSTVFPPASHVYDPGHVLSLRAVCGAIIHMGS